MSLKKICCPNIGCEEEFEHRMQCWRHEKKCSKPVPEKESTKIKYNVTLEKKFHCFDCNMVFKQKPGIYKHTKGRCKKEKKLYRCDICQKVFDRSDQLKAHIDNHNKSPLICPKCYREYRRQDHFDKHILACSDVLPSFVSETAFVSSSD